MHAQLMGMVQNSTHYPPIMLHINPFNALSPTYLVLITSLVCSLQSPYVVPLQ